MKVLIQYFHFSSTINSEWKIANLLFPEHGEQVPKFNSVNQYINHVNSKWKIASFSNFPELGE